jgi:hypothetical protein
MSSISIQSNLSLPFTKTQQLYLILHKVARYEVIILPGISKNIVASCVALHSRHNCASFVGQTKEYVVEKSYLLVCQNVVPSEGWWVVTLGERTFCWGEGMVFT